MINLPRRGKGWPWLLAKGALQILYYTVACKGPSFLPRALRTVPAAIMQFVCFLSFSNEWTVRNTIYSRVVIFICFAFYHLAIIRQPESEGLSVRVLKAGHFLLLFARYATYLYIYPRTLLCKRLDPNGGPLLAREGFKKILWEFNRNEIDKFRQVILLAFDT